MWSVWLVFCDCGFHSVCPLKDKYKKLMETSWWEILTVGETGSCSDGWGRAQYIFNPKICWWAELCSLPPIVVLMMPPKLLILCRPLLFLPSVFPSIKVFSSELDLHIKWSKYWSFSFSTSLLNIQGWFPLRLTGLILLSKGLSRVFSSATIQKHQFFSAQP